jgi:16S rRNA (adenine1518-N6/adenine1519-N6)-dimethyltransferase
MKRHRLGQHYLVDPRVAESLINAAVIRKDETVVEIGTGRGVLTGALARACARLDGYEVDRENYEETLARTKESNAFIHLADAFEQRPEFDVLVSSLPYSRSLDFVEWISQVDYSRGAVILQEDFVRKVLAPPGSRDYRGVSAIAQISSDVTEVGRVARSAFQPPPRVNSLIVLFRPRVRLTEKEVASIKRLFSLRRREVSSALRTTRMRESRPSYGGRRVSSLTPAEVYEICSERGA